jgi:hypothetical protein
MSEAIDNTAPSERYIIAACQHGSCSLSGDHKAANKAYRQLMRALREIKSLQDGAGVLVGLLDHPNEWVKLWASTHLLPIREEIGLEVLQRLAAQTKSLVEFNAKMVLQEWASQKRKS